MKKLVFLFFLLASIICNAQGIDSTKINQSITLPLSSISYIKDCIGTSGDVVNVKFYNQVAEQIDTTSYNPNQSITVIVPSWFVRDCYTSVSQQPEGVANPINDEIKSLLLPQVTNQWLMNQLIEIAGRNIAAREQRIQNGYNYFKQIK